MKTVKPMGILIIKSRQDLHLIKSNMIVVFETGCISVPADWTMTRLENVHILGNTAPGGKVLFKDNPVVMIDCKNIEFLSCAFRLTRREGANPEHYEKIWNSPKILHDNTAHDAGEHTKFRNISFVHCSMSGNTDEIDAGPINHYVWRRDNAEYQFCGYGLLFHNCIIGPSSLGKMRGRERHNFGTATSHVDNVRIINCVYAGHNRRMNQFHGRGMQQGCVIYGYGTQAIGIKSGSVVDIRNNLFLPSSNTPHEYTPGGDRLAPIRFVSGSSGTAQIQVTDNHEVFTTGKHWFPRSSGNTLEEALSRGFVDSYDKGHPQDFEPIDIKEDPWAKEDCRLQKIGLGVLDIAGCFNRDQLDENTCRGIRAGDLGGRDSDEFGNSLTDYLEKDPYLPMDAMIPDLIQYPSPSDPYNFDLLTTLRKIKKGLREQ